MILRALPVLLLLSACGAPRAGSNRALRAQIEPTPAWRTEEGRLKIWRDLAEWYVDNNLPAQAIEMVLRLRDHGEDDMALDLLQARALVAQGVPEEADHLLQRLLREQPRHPGVHQTLGIVQADLGEIDKAIKTFRRALELDDSHTPTRNNLGFLLMAHGACEEAVTELEVVLESNPAVARYRNNLAYALVCSGEPARALSLFRSTHPSEADVRYNMGLAYERIDSLPSAELQYREALVADPHHLEATEALARLEAADSPLPNPTPQGAP